MPRFCLLSTPRVDPLTGCYSLRFATECTHILHTHPAHTTLEQIQTLPQKPATGTRAVIHVHLPAWGFHSSPSVLPPGWFGDTQSSYPKGLGLKTSTCSTVSCWSSTGSSCLIFLELVKFFFESPTISMTGGFTCLCLLVIESTLVLSSLFLYIFYFCFPPLPLSFPTDKIPEQMAFFECMFSLSHMPSSINMAHQVWFPSLRPL